ncbi:MAG TPA: uroporphyrinogen decarboxylase family protein [Terriglobia bacterium]|nr:uroporphyrinogen decarboxylase family protein [Terriglobia bacterium]
MNRRERLMATLRGEPVDRPAVSFYELNGMDENPADPDPFNIFSHPSWLPLIELTHEKTDRIVMRGIAFKDVLPDPLKEIAQEESYVKDGSRFTIKTIRAGNHSLTSCTRRDPNVNTVWTVEPLLKNARDLEIFLQLPAQETGGTADPSPVLEAERALGNTGIVMIDTPDPLCLGASLFEMGEYMVVAMTEPRLFNQLLDHFASILHPQTEAVASALPGHLWRIYGPEYASPPYLPPRLFREYVCRYDTPMISSIGRSSGFARIHCHGRLRLILDDIVSMGALGLDPVEPPPQGDVELAYVRKNYGKHLILFGNLEISDIENLPTKEFAEKVKRALDEGTTGDGKGFVLMPSSCPCGRELSDLALRNYERIIEIVEG